MLHAVGQRWWRRQLEKLMHIVAHRRTWYEGLSLRFQTAGHRRAHSSSSRRALPLMPCKISAPGVLRCCPSICAKIALYSEAFFAFCFFFLRPLSLLPLSGVLDCPRLRLLLLVSSSSSSPPPPPPPKAAQCSNESGTRFCIARGQINTRDLEGHGALCLPVHQQHHTVFSRNLWLYEDQ